MSEDHPTQEALEGFMLGRLSVSRMREVSRHLLGGCPECQQATAGLWEPEEEEDLAVAPALALEQAAEKRDEYDEVLDRVFARVAATEESALRERALGRELFEELMRHPAARQHLLVSNSARFRNRMLCECLLEESHEAGFQDPARSLDLARLAVTISGLLTAEGCSGGEEAVNSLRARAWAQVGNAHRIGSDHAAAERAFAEADSLLSDPAGVGLLDRARVLDLLASLRRDQRRFGEASFLLDHVGAIYQKLGQWNLLGHTLRQKAMVYGEVGDQEAEMALLRRALDLIDPQEEPRSFLAARHNLIYALHESGRSREAFALLFHTRPLYLKTGERMNLLRLRWLEGLVAQGLHRIEQAEVAFREVREAFIELEIDYDAALASLDLAGVYVLQGRTADVRRLAEEMMAVFSSREIHREAMAALLVFCTAARLEQVGIGLVQEVSGFLKRARNNPDLRFTRSS